MTSRDYYEILGLDTHCSLKDIRTAFKKLALRWHPDKNENKLESAKVFNQIYEAYSVLSNGEKRKLYDTFGHAGLRNSSEANFEYPDFSMFANKEFCREGKSAFEVLKDIFEENDDEYFFKYYDDFGISDVFKSSVTTFLNKYVIDTEDEEEHSSTNFFNQARGLFTKNNLFTKKPSPKKNCEKSTSFSFNVYSYPTCFFTEETQNPKPPLEKKINQTIYPKNASTSHETYLYNINLPHYPTNISMEDTTSSEKSTHSSSSEEIHIEESENIIRIKNPNKSGPIRKTIRKVEKKSDPTSEIHKSSSLN